MTPLVAFMVGVNKMDRERISPRDLLVLFAIKTKPGMNGVELYQALNLRHRSGVQNSTPRLIERGWIEDRRILAHDLTPSDFHITRAGETMLADLVQHG